MPSEEVNYNYIAMALLTGIAFSAALIGLEMLCRQFELRAFNTITAGLFFGCLMGEALLLVFHSIVNDTISHPNSEVMSLVRICLFLSAIYIGMIMTAKAADRFSLSIPFFNFNPNIDNKQKVVKRKKLLVDSSLVLDSHFVDVAASGLLDGQLILPCHIQKEFSENSESNDENIRSRGRRGLDSIKKLESFTSLEMEYSDVDFPDIKDSNTKNLCLARSLNSNVFTAETLNTGHFSVENIRVINFHNLMTVLKPLAQMGEFINIKIQRYGKEPRQGVGYLDDGTMVVVNGGAEYIGEGIRVQVLSVKHTASGRMIFCNTIEEAATPESMAINTDSFENSVKSYFTV